MLCHCILLALLPARCCEMRGHPSQQQKIGLTRFDPFGLLDIRFWFPPPFHDQDPLRFSPMTPNTIIARQPNLATSKSSLNLIIPTVETMAVPNAAHTYTKYGSKQTMRLQTTGYLLPPQKSSPILLTAYAMLISRLLSDRANPNMLQTGDTTRTNV